MNKFAYWILPLILGVVGGVVGGYLFQVSQRPTAPIVLPTQSESDLVPELTPEQLFSDCADSDKKRCVGANKDIPQFALCLNSKRETLTEKCSAQVERINAVIIPCLDEVKRFCADIPLGGGRLHKCLVQNSKQASATCRNALIPK